MKEHGILFSAPMVLALLAGRKTQTRRLETSPLSRVQVGDRLWVRETFAFHWATNDQKPKDVDPEIWSVRYFADDYIRPAKSDGGSALLDQCKKKRPAIHMPRWASRITLEVTGKRVEFLQDITNADAIAEGIEPAGHRDRFWKAYAGEGAPFAEARDSYFSLWRSLHGSVPELGPKVLVLEFERISNG